jgi:hypothetical protein
MARDVICDMDKVEIATRIIGDTKTGEQVGLCDGCFIMWALAVLDECLTPEAKAVVVTQWAPKTPAPAPEGAGAQDAPKSRSEPRRRSRRPGRDPEQAQADQAAAEAARAAQEAESDRGVAQAPATPDDT